MPDIFLGSGPLPMGVGQGGGGPEPFSQGPRTLRVGSLKTTSRSVLFIFHCTSSTHCDFS